MEFKFQLDRTAGFAVKCHWMPKNFLIGRFYYAETGFGFSSSSSSFNSSTKGCLAFRIIFEHWDYCSSGERLLPSWATCLFLEGWDIIIAPRTIQVELNQWNLTMPISLKILILWTISVEPRGNYVYVISEYLEVNERNLATYVKSSMSLQFVSMSYLENCWFDHFSF